LVFSETGILRIVNPVRSIRIAAAIGEIKVGKPEKKDKSGYFSVS
jgi:hypothetical protein